MEKIKKDLIFFTIALIGFIPFTASAAKFNIVPQAGAITNGLTFTVNIYVSSPDQSMNGVSAAISYPTNLVSVTSISKFGSIINVWAQEPTFSNTSGTIHFEGVALSPGFTGSNGKIISVTFKAKAVGIANIKFLSGSILANDGLGTDILEGLGNSQFKIVQPEITPTVPKTIEVVVEKILPVINPPSITYYKSKINEGDSIVIKGKSEYSNSKVVVGLQYENFEPISYTILTDKLGEYVFAETTGAKEGIYKIWTRTLNDDGTMSTSSIVSTIFVNPISSFVIDQSKINIFIIILISLILLYLIRISFKKKHRTKREFSDIILNADKLANVKLNNFNKYINSQIEVLESDNKFKNIYEYEALIENFKKSIEDYKHNIEKKEK